MTDRFEGKVALVTGGASGIGKATVLRFLAEGARVVAADYNAANGEALVDEVAADGADKALRFVRTDVTQEADVEAAVATAVEEFGRLDIMFNNAGIGGAFGPVTDITVDDWDYTFAVLVRGVFLGTKHAVRQFKTQGDGGCVVNTASVAGIRAGAGPLAYSTAKAGVVNFTRAAALELAPFKIRVNAICPGGINTPLLNFGNEQAVGQVLDNIQPWPEHGRPEDIAAAALFLASDDARFITGEHLVVDGGLTITARLFAEGGAGLRNARAGDGGGLQLPEGVSGLSFGSTGEMPKIRMPGQTD